MTLTSTTAETRSFGAAEGLGFGGGFAQPFDFECGEGGAGAAEVGAGSGNGGGRESISALLPDFGAPPVYLSKIDRLVICTNLT